MGVEKPIDYIPGGEPVYEIMTDKSKLATITKALKDSGFGDDTRYISSFTKDNIALSITQFGGKAVLGGFISLDKTVDFIETKKGLTITDEGLEKMKAHLTKLKNFYENSRKTKLILTDLSNEIVPNDAQSA